jgi:hypothetical protein
MGQLDDTARQLLREMGYQAERQAHAEARRIVAGLVERIPPAIEAPLPTPTEARESPVSSGPGDRSTEPPTPAEALRAAQSGSERRWWEFWR